MATKVCDICPRHCNLSEGKYGLCKGRYCKDGRIICANYGKLTSIALDPIEKKPLRRFHPGSYILSVGSYGCNMHCPFCQNSEISMSDEEPTIFVTPEKLIAKAKELTEEDNIGIAYTYNEPFISYEYLNDCSILAHQSGMKNVIVTNGMICEKPLKDLLPHIDAMNIDLKAFRQESYDILGGNLETVKRTIELSAESCHIEVTTLIVPGMNDTDEEITAISGWLSSLDGNIPYHISRFFPRYKMCDASPTPVEKVYHLAEIARKKLKYVYTGNC